MVVAEVGVLHRSGRGEEGGCEPGRHDLAILLCAEAARSLKAVS